MKFKISLTFLLLVLIFSLKAIGQSMSDTTITCTTPGQITFDTNLPPFVPPTSTNITGDDSWGSLIPIGFTFNFFGNNYTQIVPSSNGILSFNTSYAGNYCPWSIGGGIPNAGYPLNSIMGPWQDLYPPAGGGSATYGIVGTAPNRIFVFQLCQMPHYSCNSLRYSGQILLYETTNVIEVHIMSKVVCSGWNGGRAIEGIQNANGTVAFSVPGRNATAWTATNDAWRFTPTSTNSYTVTPISFFPAYLSNTPATYTWYELPSNTFIQTGMPLVVSPTQTTSYRVVSNMSCLNATFADTVTVTINNTLTINAVANAVGVSPGQDITICNGNMTTLNSGGGGVGATYTWSPASSLMTPNDSITICAPSVSTQYIVTVTNPAGCVGTDTINITVNDLPIVDVTAGPSVCYNSNPININCTPAGGTLTGQGIVGTTFIPDATSGIPSSGGTFTINYVYTDPNGCMSSDAAQQTVWPLPQPQIIDLDNQYCIDATPVRLMGMPDPNSPTGGYFTVDGFVSSMMNPFMTGTGIHHVVYTFTDQNGCTDSTSQDVTVNPLPIVSFTGLDSTYCQYDPTVTLSPTPNGPTGIFSGNGIVGNTFNPGTAVPDTNVITYTYTNPSTNCTNFILHKTFVITTPIADFEANSLQMTNEDPTFTFENTSLFADSYIWNLGDDDIEYTQDIAHTYADTGTYHITLIASNQGCTDTTQTDVIVIPAFLFYMPNAFTPNGDGTNDTFQPQGLGITSFNIIIFDRWGNTIFQSNNMSISWDGGNVPQGTYIYRINVIDYTGASYEYNGYLSVLR